MVAPPDRLRLQDVMVRYGDFLALDNINLAIRPGEFVSLLGPSGSGKSTILNVINGAAHPDGGRVFIDGRDVTAVPARERGLGMVFQNYALLPHMNVFDNIAFPLRIRHWPAERIRQAVTDILHRMGLEGFAHRKPRELSGGQQQRVGIARCLVYSPSIILMDEPLGALDKNMREQMQDEIKALHRATGATFVYVTHDQEEALNLSDRICLMNRGRIEQIGTPQEMYFTPVSEFTATFLGESNILAGRLVAENLFRSECGLSIHVVGRPDIPVGSHAKLLVRPEHVMCVAPAADIPNRFACIVENVNFVGGFIRVAVRGQGGGRLQFKTRAHNDYASLQIDSEIHLGWLASDTVLLPA
ncbi:ABC transporter ATP-binding protein [Komagataeibacter xylinus]|uniref:ABC transporter ATP-binding protein n=1 Tax=Komagataeibacter xylinus TaxID=28448 RepID=UPI001A92989C|nr:ABC transporter ATP-binding protein [Komagataeibacter xylinus]